MLAIVDDFTREGLALIPDTWLSGVRVPRELDVLIARRGRPKCCVSEGCRLATGLRCDMAPKSFSSGHWAHPRRRVSSLSGWLNGYAANPTRRRRSGRAGASARRHGKLNPVGSSAQLSAAHCVRFHLLVSPSNDAQRGKGSQRGALGPHALARQLFTGLQDSNWSIGLIEEETIRDPAGAIHRIARSVDDGHVRPNGPELSATSQPLRAPASWMSVKTTSMRRPLAGTRWRFRQWRPEEHPIPRCAVLKRSGSVCPLVLDHEDNPRRAIVAHALFFLILGRGAPITARRGILS